VPPIELGPGPGAFTFTGEQNDPNGFEYLRARYGACPERSRRGDLRFKYGSTPTDRLFTGEQRDLETGLDYLRARYYDPATGRFVSRGADAGSGGRPWSQNRFAYVEGNPVIQTDPSGMCLSARGMAIARGRRLPPPGPSFRAGNARRALQG